MIEAELAKRDVNYVMAPDFNFAFQANRIELEILQHCDGWEMARLNPLVVLYHFINVANILVNFTKFWPTHKLVLYIFASSGNAKIFS